MTAVAALYSVYQGYQQYKTGQYNAAVDKNEANAAINQSAAQAAVVQRQGREALGRQAAAFGAAGVGYGGSSLDALKQSAINSEMDVLNTRYKGAITAYGYDVRASQEKQAGTNALLLAGGKALAGVYGSYGSPQGDDLG